MAENEVEETEPQAEENEDSKGIPGQIQYEDPETDAERAGEFVAGKVDTLEPVDEDEDDEAREARRARQTPQENRMEDIRNAEAAQSAEEDEK